MKRGLGVDAAERQLAKKRQDTSSDRSQSGKVREFVDRKLPFIRHILSWGGGKRISEPTAHCSSEGDDMSRPVSATSKQFLLMSEIFVKNGYMVGPKIGSGNYAKVRVVERKSDGKILAAKIIFRDKAPKEYVKKFMPRELEIVQCVRHENIAYVYEVVQTDKMVFMVMEYASGGDLLEYIKNKGPPPERERKKIFRQIVSAVQHLHSYAIVHRDLKCENILLKKNGDTLLTDFGFSRRYEAPGYGSKTYCGSAAYASPQLVEGIPYDPYQNDVWSLGCILFILSCGSMPFDDSNMTKLVERQKKGVHYPSKVKDKVSRETKALISKLLEPDESKRCSIKDILKDPWLQPEQEEPKPEAVPEKTKPGAVPEKTKPGAVPEKTKPGAVPEKK